MSDKNHQHSEEEAAQRKDGPARRDTLLLRLLKTPPQPRPKRERDQSVTPKGKKAKKAPAK